MGEQVFSPKAIPINAFVYSVSFRIPNIYIVTKWDGLLNIEAIYELRGKATGTLSCPCWAGRWGSGCKHRPIIRQFHILNRIGHGWFYDLDNNRWYLPLRVS